MYGGAGAAWSAFFCLEPEPTQIGQSRSRLLDLGLPEPPNKVAAPQHYLTPHPPFWISTKTSMFESDSFLEYVCRLAISIVLLI